MSARVSIVSSPRACSGATYCGVPIIMPLTVSRELPPAVRARPRSQTFTMPSGVNMMLSGLMSR